jgi:orotate phosphoribosyltransferase-like protein
LPFQPTLYKDDPDTLFVGIQREGYQLAQSMGCMPEGHSIAPHAKRIHFEDGLLVGLTGISALSSFRRCVLIDGAIATGSTLIAILEQLKSSAGSFYICSAHATVEGIQAILRYAERAGLDLKIVVGHATRGLNDHFYATLPSDPGKLVVGDLGDTISELG